MGRLCLAGVCVGPFAMNVFPVVTQLFGSGIRFRCLLSLVSLLSGRRWLSLVGGGAVSLCTCVCDSNDYPFPSPPGGCRLSVGACGGGRPGRRSLSPVCGNGQSDSVVTVVLNELAVADSANCSPQSALRPLPRMHHADMTITTHPISPAVTKVRRYVHIQNLPNTHGGGSTAHTERVSVC